MQFRSLSLVLVCLLGISLLPGCSRIASQVAGDISPSTAWNYSDLRLLDPPDDVRPELDLLAVYLHPQPSGAPGRIELRLDFLDLTNDSQPDVFIALDYLPGGATQIPLDAAADIAWDTLISLPSTGELGAYDTRMTPSPASSIRLLRNGTQDSLTISLELPYPQPFDNANGILHLRGQVFTANPGSGQLADRSAVFTPFSPSPQPAHLLLAFWNTFPAYTPAQALRRWDGAHTGPLGGRHGLSNLLRLAQNHAITIALLDLRSPTWLSALDYGGDWERLTTMAESGLALIPDYLTPAGSASAQELVMDLADRFGLPAARSVYAQTTLNFPGDYPLVFYPSASGSALTALASIRQQRLLPIPVVAVQSAPGMQPDSSGLSLDARRALAAAAQAATLEAQPILILGGSLPDTSWAAPDAARPAFEWIRQHPWIHPISATDLLGMSPQRQESLPPARAQSPLPDAPLDELPANNYNYWLYAETAASLLALEAPAAPPSPAFTALREAYRGQAQILRSAADWSADPQPLASCSQDLDLDGEPECVLASEQIFLVFDLSLGALTHAFTVQTNGIHQFIAPSSQFTIGSGDPNAWQPGQGLASDPQVIPGAFAGPLGPYQSRLEGDRLVLVDPAGSVRKTFTLLEDGLRVEITAPQGYAARLPLAVDPWQRFNPDWASRYAADAGDRRFTWGIPSELLVGVASATPMNANTFLDTQDLMGRQENPNRDYPPGHYLPLPLALLDISGAEISLEIHLRAGE